jgi:hypothetical protein
VSRQARRDIWNAISHRSQTALASVLLHRAILSNCALVERHRVLLVVIRIDCASLLVIIISPCGHLRPVSYCISALPGPPPGEGCRDHLNSVTPEGLTGTADGCGSDPRHVMQAPWVSDGGFGLLLLNWQLMLLPLGSCQVEREIYCTP